MVHSIVVTGLLKYLDLSWADDLAEPPEATHVGGLRNNGTEAERATTQVCDHHYTNYKAKSQVMKNLLELIVPIIANNRTHFSLSLVEFRFQTINFISILKSMLKVC